MAVVKISRWSKCNRVYLGAVLPPKSLNSVIFEGEKSLSLSLLEYKHCYGAACEKQKNKMCRLIQKERESKPLALIFWTLGEVIL